MKLTTFITNFLVLFSIILNSVMNTTHLKKPNIETIIEKQDSSKIQISLNNTSNQISLIFEKNQNSNSKVDKDSSQFILRKPNNNTSLTNNLTKLTMENMQEKLIVNRRVFNTEETNSLNVPQKESFFESNLRDEIKKNPNFKLEEKHKQFNSHILNLKDEGKFNSKIYEKNKENMAVESMNHIIKLNQNLQKQQNLSHSQSKKIKYFEALKNIKKIKNRLNSYNNRNNSNTKYTSKEPDSASALGDLDINISLNDLSKITEANIKDEILFEEFLKQKGSSKKKRFSDEEDNNSTLFYNSISLIMLSMLGGGVVGVVFILYFTFKNESISNRYE